MRGSSLHSIINCLFDQTPNFRAVPQHLVSRDPQYLVPLLCQVLVAALIMLAAFVGLMMLTIDLNDQLQCHATEIDGVWWNWVFTAELLISTTTTAQHLPHVLRKLVRTGSLIASKRNRVWIAPRSSVHVAPPIHDRD